MYQEIAGVTSVPKGMNIPAQINKSFVLSYDNFNEQIFETLPDFIKDKMKGSLEYVLIANPNMQTMDEQPHNESVPSDDLPF